MTFPVVLIILVGSVLWLLRYRFRDRFLRAYGLFFLVLLVYASNKEYYGLPSAMYESAVSPLSLIRWGLLLLLVWMALRMKRPAGFRADILLGALVVSLLSYVLISSVYADDFGYSFMRGLSITLLTVALVKGLSSHLFSSVNCLNFFRLKYYVIWITIPLMFVMLISGVYYGVTLIGGQYAGLFGNQNTFGAFSALIMPYALFHWRAVARKKWEKAADLFLIATIFSGLWFSRSRNGLASCVAAIAVYFFVLNARSRIKSVIAATCVVLAFVILPTLKTDLTRFLRKGIEVSNISSQIIEEKRFEMWRGVWPLFWKEKLTGYGFASSHQLVFPFTQDAVAGRSVHNSYLEIFGDLGLPGLILLLLIFYRVTRMAVTLTLQRGEYLERNINATFISVFIAGSANAFLESWMFSVGNLISLMYWVCVTGLVARWAWRPAEAPEIAPVQSLKTKYSYTGASSAQEPGFGAAGKGI
jgi:O-antigen ligase